jgi:hypothetical protein
VAVLILILKHCTVAPDAKRLRRRCWTANYIATFSFPPYPTPHTTLTYRYCMSPDRGDESPLVDLLTVLPYYLCDGPEAPKLETTSSLNLDHTEGARSRLSGFRFLALFCTVCLSVYSHAC